jgi:hypothetical protein
MGRGDNGMRTKRRGGGGEEILLSDLSDVRDLFGNSHRSFLVSSLHFKVLDPLKGVMGRPPSSHSFPSLKGGLLFPFP